MDWESCMKRNLVKSIKQDEPFINSLVKGAEKKVKSHELLPLNGTTASSKVTLINDALRELLEALAIKHGFKIYNHECYCAFLKEIVHKNILAEQFDSYRKIRNAINYYGKDIKAEEAGPVIREITSLIREIRKLLD